MENKGGILMSAIKNNYIVKKRNILNEIRSNSMTLQELRFFSIYLSKINSRDVKTRVVRFPILDFQKIMELENRIKIDYLKNVTDSLLCKIVHLPLDSGGYTAFQLFKRCKVYQDEDDTEWYMEIDAHDEALPLMFEFKNRYFTYQLWNALKLKSSNQLRMYEILKQYEKIGERVITVDELKVLLGIDTKKYPRFGDFKVFVLDSCRKALEESTDIKFTYEPIRKSGKGGKIASLKFVISKNEDYQDQLSLDEFIDQQENTSETSDEAIANDFIDERLNFFAEACRNEFSIAETQILYNLIIQIMPHKVGQNNDLNWYDYLKRKHDELNWRAGRTKISNRFGYLKKLLETDLNQRD